MNAEFIIQTALIFTSAYFLASMAGIISEKSGIVNISIEGTMIMGAIVYHLTTNVDGLNLQESLGPYAPLAAMLLSGLVGVLFGLLLGVASVTFHADQVIAGTGINLLAPSLYMLMLILVTSKTDPPFTPTVVSISAWYPLFLLSLTILIGVVIWVVINKTSIGLRLRTAGENPYAAATSGLSVTKIRYIALIIAGFLAGMAGAIVRMPGNIENFFGTVYGAGFISIAILILGRHKVLGVLAGSILIAFLNSFISEGIGSINNLAKYEYLFMTIPFILPLVVLAVSKNSSSPNAVGKPFNKSNRE